MKMYRLQIVNGKTGDEFTAFSGYREIVEIEQECVVSLLLFVGAAENFHTVIEEVPDGK